MPNTAKLIKEAEEAFLSGEYKIAMLHYGNLLTKNPNNKEFIIKAILCDIALEDEEKAQALYDYFNIEKSKDYDEAISQTLDIIEAYDGDMDKLNKILSSFSNTIETLNAITYEDFQKIVKVKGNFKLAFEDIAYSTKVVITDKDDFYDFIDNLIKNDYLDTAYNYIENSIPQFNYDKKIQELTTKLKHKLDLVENSSENIKKT